MVEKLKPVANGSDIDIMHYLNLCTVDILLSTIMGIEAGAQNNEIETFVKCVEIGYRTVHERMLKVWLHPDILFRFSQCYKDTKYAQGIIREFAVRKLEMKKKEFALRRANNEVDEDQLTTIEHLLLMNETGSYFNDEELRDEIYTIFTAGQDTTATITAFVLLMLGMHPEIQVSNKHQGYKV